MPDPGIWLVVIGGGGVVGLFATIRLWLQVRFLRHVYDHGGTHDLRAAGSALHPRRLDRSSRATPRMCRNCVGDARS